MSTSLHHHSHYLNPGSHFFFFFFWPKLLQNFPNIFLYQFNLFKTGRMEGRKEDRWAGRQAGLSMLLPCIYPFHMKTMKSKLQGIITTKSLNDLASTYFFQTCISPISILYITFCSFLTEL